MGQGAEEVNDFTEEQFNKALAACWSSGSAPIELSIGWAQHRIILAIMAYPNHYKKFLKDMDETERYLARKYSLTPRFNS